MYSNKSPLIRLGDRLKDLDSRVNQLDLNRHNRIGLKLKPIPLRLVLERTILRGEVTQDSSPPLNKTLLPQSSESQPFPLPILPCTDIPVGGRLAHFMEQWGELTNSKWVLYRSRWFQDTIQVNSPSFARSDKSKSIFLPFTARRGRGTSSEMGSGKGTRSGNTQFLFPVISCSKKGMESCIR